MKRKLIFLVLILSMIFSAVGVTSVVNKRTGNKGPISALGYTTTTMDKPESGDPTDFDSYDNLAIVAGLMEKNNFTGITNGEVNANVAFMKYTQNVYNVRTVIDNRAFQQAISESSLKSVGQQKYFFLDQNKVLTREPNKIAGENTTWKDGLPTVYSNKQYLGVYGWLPNQISSYILCKETIVSISDLKTDEFGNYYLEISLDPSKAPANYQYEVKAYGGASEFPSFSSVNMKVTFDDEWVLKQIDTVEIYDITMPVIGSITCTGTLTEKFTYSDLNIEQKDYFEQYKDLKPSDGEDIPTPELGPMDYLMYGFGDYLSGEVGYFDVELSIQDKTINGRLALDILNNKYAFISDNLSLIVENKDVYLSIAGLKLRMNIDELFGLIDSKKSSNDLANLIDLDGIMNALQEATIEKNGNDVKLNVNIPLLGEVVPVIFHFNEESKTDISLKGIEANLNIKDLNLSISLSNSNNKFEYELDPNEYENINDLRFLFEDLKNIIESGKFSFNFEFSKEDLLINGAGEIHFANEVAMLVNATINYKGNDIALVATYKENLVVIEIGKLKLSMPIDDFNMNFDLNQILRLLINLPWQQVINSLEIDDGKLDLDVNLNVFNENLDSLKIKIYDTNDGFAIDCSTLNLKLQINRQTSIEEITLPDGPYFDIRTLKEYLPIIKEIYNNGVIDMTLNTKISYGFINIPVSGNIKINLKEFGVNGKLEANILGKTLDIILASKDGYFYLELGNNLSIKLSNEEIASLLGENSSKIDISNIINSIENENGKMILKLNLLGKEIGLAISPNDNGINIVLEEIELGSIKLTDTSLDIRTSKEYEEYQPKENNITKENIDNLMNLVGKIEELMANNVNINMKINENINLNLIVDKNLNISGSINLYNNEISFNKIGNTLYISYGNLKVKGDLKTLIEIADEILNVYDLSIRKIIEDLVAKVDLNNLINNLEIKEKELSFNVLLEGKESLGIKIDYENEIKLNILAGNISIEGNIEGTKENIGNVNGEYYDIANLKPFIPFILEILKGSNLSIDVNTTIEVLGVNCQVSGNIKINLKEFGVNGKLKANILGKTLDIILASKDGYFYLELGNNLSIKLSNEEIASLLGENSSKIDISNIINSIENENGKMILKLNLLGKEIGLAISPNDNGINIVLEEIELGSIKLTDTSLDIRTSKEYEEYQPKENNITKENIDNLMNLVGKIEELMANNVNINMKINENINLNLIVDKNLNISGSINLYNNEISFNKIGNTLYISYGNLKVKGDLKTLIEIADEILNVYDLSIRKIIEDLVAKVDLNNLINNLEIKEKELSFNVLLEGKESLGIKIDYENEIKLNILAGNISIEGNIEGTKENIGNVNGEYYDIANLKPFIPFILEILKGSNLSIDVNTTIEILGANYNLCGKILVDFKNGFSFDGYITDGTTNLITKISLLDSNLNVIVGNIKIKTSLTDIAEILPLFNFDLNNINLADMISGIKYVDGITTLSLNINGLNIDLGIKYENEMVCISISDIISESISLRNLKLSMESTANEPLEIEVSDYIDSIGIKTIFDTINKLFNVIDSKMIAINFSTNLNLNSTNFKVEGLLKLDFRNTLAMELNVDFITNEGVIHKVNAYLYDETIYVQYGNIGIKLRLNELGSLINKIEQTFNMDLSLPKIDNLGILEIISKINVKSSADKTSILLGNLSLIIDKNLNISIGNIINNAVSISDTSLTITEMPNFDITIPEVKYIDYNSLSLLLDYVRSFIDVCKEDKLSLVLNGNMNVDNVSYVLSGSLKLNLSEKDNLGFEALLSLTTSQVNYNSHFFKIILKDGRFYITYKNNLDSPNSLSLMANTSDLMGLLNTISEFLNFDFSQIEDTIDKVEGFNIFDLINKIDFAKIIKDISISKDNLAIVLAKELLGSTDDLIISLAMNGNSISGLEVNNLYALGYNLNFALEINDEDFTIEIPSNLDNFYDLSSLNPLIKSIFNDAKLKDFHITSTINVNANIIGININMSVPIDIKIKMIEGSVYPEIYARIGAIPVITGVNNDVPYKFGDTVSNGSPGMNRILNIYYKDHMVYFHRTETIPVFASSTGRQYEKKLMISDTTLLEDPLYYLLKFGFGFSDSIMDAINSSMNTGERPPIDFTNVLKDYHYDDVNSKYVLSINLAELTNNSQLGNFDLELYTKVIDEEDYLYKASFSMNMPLADAVSMKLSTDSLELVDIKQSVDLNNLIEYVNNYSYQEDIFWEYDGSWHIATNNVTLYFEENGGPLVNDITALPSSEINLPTYDKYTLIDGKYYYFLGWYTSSTFEEGTLFTNNKMPRNGGMLYARWEEVPTYEITIKNEMLGDTTYSFYEGMPIILPEFDRVLEIDSKTYEYSGLYFDSAYSNEFNLVNMPGENLVLYLWYKEITPANLTIYDGEGNIHSTIEIALGTNLNLNVLPTIPTYFNNREHKLLGWSLSKDGELIKDYLVKGDFAIYPIFEDMYKIHYDDKQGNAIDTWVESGYKFVVPTLTESDIKTYNTNKDVYLVEEKLVVKDGFSNNKYKDGDEVIINSDFSLEVVYKNAYYVYLNGLTRRVWGLAGYAEAKVEETLIVEEGEFSLIGIGANNRTYYTDYSVKKRWNDYVQITMTGTNSLFVNSNVNVYYDTGNYSAV